MFNDLSQTKINILKGNQLGPKWRNLICGTVFTMNVKSKLFHCIIVVISQGENLFSVIAAHDAINRQFNLVNTFFLSLL